MTFLYDTPHSEKSVSLAARRFWWEDFFMCEFAVRDHPPLIRRHPLWCRVSSRKENCWAFGLGVGCRPAAVPGCFRQWRKASRAGRVAPSEMDHLPDFLTTAQETDCGMEALFASVGRCSFGLGIAALASNSTAFLPAFPGPSSVGPGGRGAIFSRALDHRRAKQLEPPLSHYPRSRVSTTVGVRRC